jgi:hypothetical protein
LPRRAISAARARAGDRRAAARVDLAEGMQESQAGEGIVEMVGLQDSDLQAIAGVLAAITQRPLP